MFKKGDWVKVNTKKFPSHELQDTGIDTFLVEEVRFKRNEGLTYLRLAGQGEAFYLAVGFIKVDSQLVNRNATFNEAFDNVTKPKHYQVVGNTEAKDLIKVMLEQYVKDNPEATPYQIYCAGNIFKYRLRVGEKDDPKQELGKIKQYGKMHDGTDV